VIGEADSTAAEMFRRLSSEGAKALAGTNKHAFLANQSTAAAAAALSLGTGQCLLTINHVSGCMTQ
jgi:hypothetical protein